MRQSSEEVLYRRAFRRWSLEVFGSQGRDMLFPLGECRPKSDGSLEAVSH